MSYCVRANIEAKFGAANVKSWADLDNDGDTTKITNAITAAIAEADEEIDARFRDGKYVVPFVGLSTTTPTLIKQISVMLSASVLYDARGIEDTDPVTQIPVNRLGPFRRRAEALMDRVASGELKLDAALYTDASPVPEIVTDPDEEDPSTPVVGTDFI